MMYKILIHRNGMKEEIDGFDSFEEALDYGTLGGEMGEYFFEYVLDENNVILYDGIDNVIGREREVEVVGTVYEKGKR